MFELATKKWLAAFRSARKTRGLSRRRVWCLEQLEDRVVPTVIDLTTAGASGTLNGAIFNQFTQSGTGSGSIQAFVRLATTNAVEQGYNTDYRPVQFDEKNDASFTHAVQLSTIPTVTDSGGNLYYEFLLVINQKSSYPNNLLSLDELRVYVTNPSTVDPNKLHNYSSSTHTLQDDAGTTYSPVYDLNPTTDSNYIKLDGNLSGGTGKGDMIALIPASLLGSNTSQYVYFYSKFGVNYANTGGFEQWAAGTVPVEPVGSIKGLAFVDLNGNGVQDNGEPGQAGVTVFLDANNNGVLDPGEVSTVTAADGSFTFPNLIFGPYHVREVVPSGYIKTAQINADVTLAPAQNFTGVAFGNFQTATISGTKYEDVTGNGFSADDPVLNSSNPDYVSVTVNLYQGTTQVATTATDANGNYSFTGLGPGPYTVQEVVPNGWFQTAATGGTLALTSGENSTGNNFDNFLVAKLTNGGTILTVRSLPASGGSLSVAQPSSGTTTVNLNGILVGTFVASGLQTIQVTSYASTVVDTTQVTSVPVTIYDQPGNVTNTAGSSGTTIYLNSGGTAVVSVTGGMNTLNFSPTSFGVTFDDSQNQGQTQNLDGTGQHILQITGLFQTIVGTNFNDTLTAYLPAFNSSTGALAQGTTIICGPGQDKVYGTLGTTVSGGGAGTTYTQVLSSQATSDLTTAIQKLGASTSALASFATSVQTNAASSQVTGGVLTNVTLGGAGSTYTQVLDANSVSLLQQAISSFGSTTSGGSGTSFGSTTSGGTQFGSTTNGGTSFGSTNGGITSFGGVIQLKGTKSTVYGSVLLSVNMGGGGNSYIQTVDANAYQVLHQAINSFGSTTSGGSGTSFGSTTNGGTSFGSSTSGTTTFGATANGVTTFGGTITLDGGNNSVQTSLLTSVNMDGGSNVYVQSLNSYAVSLLQQAITSFGSTTSGGSGTSFGSTTSGGTSFGATAGGKTTFTAAVNGLPSLGGTIVLDGGNNTAYGSVLLNLSMNGGHNTYIQTVDSNAFQVLQQAITSFGSTTSGGTSFGSTTSGGTSFGSTSGGTTTFGATANGVTTFGGTVTLDGGHNAVQTSLLTGVSMEGGTNLYVQSLNANAVSLLEQAITSFGATASGGTSFGSTTSGGSGTSFTSTVTGIMTLGGTVVLDGGHNEAFGSVLLNLGMDGGYNQFVQTVDSNATQVLQASINAFGATKGGGTSFGSTTSGGSGTSFGGVVALDGGNNTAQGSLMLSVSMDGGYNLYTGTLDSTSSGFVTSAVSGNGIAAGALGALGTSLVMTGGHNTAQAGPLTSAQLSGGEDTFVERLNDTEVSMASTVLADYPSTSQATAAASLGPQASLGNGDDVVVGSLLGTFSAGVGNDRFVIEDPTLLGSSSASSQLLTYGGKFTAGAGTNTFYLAGSNFGHVAISEPAGNSDTLDLSSIQVAGPSLDLTTTSEQQVLTGQLWLTLSAPAGFATVIGNGNAATLKAGSRNVTLLGAAPLDDRTTNPPAWQGQTQVVFLDFNTYTTGSKHVYTSQEQAAILAQLQADYANFDFQFTLQQPASGSYTTLFINRTPPSGEAGGFSSEIDFRNLNPSDTADIDVNALLGGTGEPAATSANFIALTSTVAAHELGHTVGLRHLDSMGPIGFGDHSLPGVDDFRPLYPGPQAAWETTQHIIASPASVGSTLFDAVANPFFGEREDIKLAFIEGGTTVAEQTTTSGQPANTSLATAQPLTLTAMRVPNTVQRGFNAGKVFSVAAVDVINADLQLGSNNQTVDDYYAFQGRAGDLINIQALSYSLTRITDPVDTTLKVYDSSGNLLSYYTGQAFNDDEFETPDATILDLRLPTAGTYYIDVGSYNNAGAGHYELFMYRFLAGNATPAGGSNDTFIVGPGQDSIIGRGGQDTVEDSGASSYTLTNSSLTGSGTATLQNVPNAILVGSSSGTTFNVSGWTGTATLQGLAGTTNTVILSRDANFTLTNNTLTVSNGGTFTLINIQNVLLTGGSSGSTFTVSGWTGSATLTGQSGVTNTVVVSQAASLMTLTNSSLTVSGGGTFSLVNVGNAVLTGGTTGTTFDVRSWTGTDTLNSQGGPNPVQTPQGVAVSTTEGSASASLPVVTFADLGTPLATNYSANISWGDGGSSSGTFSSSGNTITGKGSHAYEEGKYTITTTFSQGSAFSVIVSSAASVTDAPLTVASTASTVPQWIALNNTSLVTFTDADTVATVSDFSGTINWGDGSSSAALFSQPGGVGTAFVVSGNHSYSLTGTYTVKATINDVGGQSATATFSLAVAPSIIVLDPSLSGALTVKGTVSIIIGGDVVVDSNSSSALSGSGNATITAGGIQVVGGLSVSNNVTLSPKPATGVAAVADPFASLAAPSGGTSYGSYSLSKGSATINPGIYTSITVSGTGTSLTMNPGIYVIAGGGFSVSNSANVTGSGVMIYNAGSNFPKSGGTFGSISLASSGSISLSAPTTGTYAGILIFQSRDNTQALSLNASSVVGVNGIIYAPAALLSLSGSSQLKSPALVDQLTLNGNGGTLTADGADNSFSVTAGHLLAHNLFLYVSEATGTFTSDELARVQDAVSGLDHLLAPFSVTITEVANVASANLVLDMGTTSNVGGLGDGVLGYFAASDTLSEITIIQGWNWYAGSDPALIQSSQYDFPTVVTHELGHALGLGHSTNPDSVMYATLSAGQSRRTMTVQDLNVPDTDSAPDGYAVEPHSSGVQDTNLSLPERATSSPRALPTGVLEMEGADATSRTDGSTQEIQQPAVPWFVTQYIAQGGLLPRAGVDIAASSLPPERNSMRDILFIKIGDDLLGDELPMMDSSRSATRIALMEESAGIQPDHGHLIDGFKASSAGSKSAVAAKRPQGSDVPEHEQFAGWSAEEASAGVCLAALLASGPELFKLNLADQFFATLPRIRNKDRREPWSAPDPLRRPCNDGTEC
jgi:hypothetical protein